MVAQEIDDILMLLSYALVYRDWQPAEVPRNARRGYNIGALLVNADNEPVSFGLNCINETGNATQHGEVRAIASYLENNKDFDLAGFTMYTTLEPCIMCAGMMIMTSVERIVFGQHDRDFSHALDRLSIDSRAIGGFPPYPRSVDAQPTTLHYCRELDDAYSDYLVEGNERILAKFLSSTEAKSIFNRAHDTLQEYEVINTENTSLHRRATAFLNSINTRSQ